MNSSALTKLRFPDRQRDQEDTRILIESGIELLLEAMQWKADRIELHWPTRESVLRRFNEQVGRRDSTYTFDVRWAYISDYFTDVFAWVLYDAQSRRQRAISGDIAASILEAGTGLPQVAAQIAANEIRSLLDSPLYRIKLLLVAMAPLPQPFSEMLDSFYRAGAVYWSKTYEAFMNVLGLRLRDGITLDMLTRQMGALEEGLILRFIGQPSAFDSSLDRLSQDLAQGAMALFAGAMTDDLGASPVDRLTRPRDA